MTLATLDEQCLGPLTTQSESRRADGDRHGRTAAYHDQVRTWNEPDGRKAFDDGAAALHGGNACTIPAM